MGDFNFVIFSKIKSLRVECHRYNISYLTYLLANYTPLRRMKGQMTASKCLDIYSTAKTHDYGCHLIKL